tara:strand:+ start:4022 stop:5488 length:1467 start_codon:yes stop_codon:yes gene_type:complete
MAGVIEVKYFNSFILRKTLSIGDVPVWNGSRGDGTYPATVPAVENVKNWAVEESRIRGGYNNVQTDLGVKAYLVEAEPNANYRVNSMIYSGIFNSRTGINDTNVFSVGTDIVKSVNPSKGSIQKLHAEDTNLIIFQESKVSKALIDKNAIYSAEGGQISTVGNVVIGPITGYRGNFGISKNPESFAIYGTRKYFTDKDRSVLLRLSSDGLTEISNYGMRDFFRDNLSSLDGQSIDQTGKAVGIWDIHSRQYVVSLQEYTNTSFKTLSFDDDVNGFPSLFSYKPDHGGSIKNEYYTVKDGSMWLHYSSQALRSNFYGTQFKSTIEFIFNPKVSMSKVFKTINYEGSNGWQVDSLRSDVTGVNSVGTPINVQGDPWILGTRDTTAIVYSFNEGSYDNYGNEYPANLIPPINHAGFTRKENKYMANLINNSVATAGEIELGYEQSGYAWGSTMTGIKGYFATVVISTDNTTDVGGMKELFAASSNYVESSY